MSDSLTVLRTADPVNRMSLELLKEAPVFDELRDAIVSGRLVADEESAITHFQPHNGRRGPESGHAKRAYFGALVTVMAALVLLAGGLALGLGTAHPSSRVSLPSGAQITPWHAARPLPVSLHPSRTHTSGSWRLVSLVANAGWRVDTSGPPPGQLSCPTLTICYALAVRYASPKAGAQPQSVSLYVSTNLGAEWSVLPMPVGFLPTSHLSCASGQVCAAGGTHLGQPAFAVTIDGGHQWGVVPMSGTRVLRELACRSSAVCVGVLSSPRLGTPSSITSIVRTTDGGTSWSTSPLPVSGTVLSLSCSTNQVCVAVGYSGIFRGAITDGFVLTSRDEGQSWSAGSLPQDFGFAPVLSAVSCANASDCMAIGVTSISNPMRCEGSLHVTPPPGFDSCDASPTALISTVATSSDGGTTWRSRALPADIPLPQLFSLSCASATVCWASGQEAVAQVIGNVHDAGSPVVVGTSDGGATWSKATFMIPSDAPNYLGQSYLAIGDITCPRPSACLALGGAAQSAPSTPIYRFAAADSS
jgi:photosystem II stability/assembly factor-like uncharacterized protein